jgi:hypothetical protein
MVVVHVTSSRKLPHSKSHSDFVVQLDAHVRHVSSVSLLHASIPNSFYTVVDGHNTFVLTRSGSDTTISLTSGVYTASQLASHLQTKLAAVVSGFTVAYSDTLFKLVCTDPSADFSLTVASARLQRVLGMASSSLSSSSQVATPPNVVQMSSNLVLIQSNALKAKTRGPAPCSFAIPLDQSPGGIVSFNAKSHYRMRHDYAESPIDLFQMDVRLVDAHGDALDTNGGSVDLVFEVTCG